MRILRTHELASLPSRRASSANALTATDGMCAVSWSSFLIFTPKKAHKEM